MLKISTNGLEEIEKQLILIPGAAEKAMRSAIIRTLKGGRQDAARLAKARYTVNAGEITRSLKVKMNGMSGSLESKATRPRLSKFKHNPKSRKKKAPEVGVFAQVVRGQGGKIVQSFLAKGDGIYQRIGAGSYPIRMLTGPAAAQMIGVPVISKPVLVRMEQRLGINALHEINAFLTGAR